MDVFRLVEYMEPMTENGQKQTPFLSECNENDPMREVAKELKISYNTVHYALHCATWL